MQKIMIPPLLHVLSRQQILCNWHSHILLSSSFFHLSFMLLAFSRMLLSSYVDFLLSLYYFLSHFSSPSQYFHFGYSSYNFMCRFASWSCFTIEFLHNCATAFVRPHSPL
ncbi:hypothetical protein WN943_001539 [Citrus x changshan-huyou]